VPDEALQPVPFASLWDRDRGRYLVESFVVGVAPSGTVFVRASAAAERRGRRPVQRALVVGNPRLDRANAPDLPDLPEAEAEASAIAGLYPKPSLLIGGEATRAAFLGGLRNSEIAHFAGHAAVSSVRPATARLFLAPGPGDHDRGVLYLQQLPRDRLLLTRVVILAACHSGAGEVSRLEGTLSLGRPFLAAGVPSVIVSRWGIDDSVSRRFFLSLHQALRLHGGALDALRQAQIALLQDGDPSLAHPASWAAFVHLGGIDPHSLLKGEVS
jgi:CHAT domain-containing protein